MISRPTHVNNIARMLTHRLTDIRKPHVTTIGVLICATNYRIVSLSQKELHFMIRIFP